MTAVEATTALRAIMFVDAEQYSTHVHLHEADALDFMEACFALLRNLGPAYNGELLKTIGDGAMLEFASATQALLFALHAQERLAEIADKQPEGYQIRFRIGIHMGEVKLRGGDVFGNIVNVASRLENFAGPGGICISQAVFEQVRQDVPASYTSLGPRHLKNIPRPVVIYRVSPGKGSPSLRPVQAASQISVFLTDRVALIDDQGKGLVLKAPKAQAMIGYLILNQTSVATKDNLLGLLWSDADAVQAEKEYRSVVQQIRRAFQKVGSDAFRSGVDGVRLNLTALQIDLLSVSEQLGEGMVPMDLLEGKLVPSRIMARLEETDPVFKSWLKVTRHRWRDRLIDQLESCLNQASDNSHARKHAASALLTMDATHEPAARVLMTLQASEGKVASAMRIFEALREVLKGEFGIEPSEETQSLFRQIQSGGTLGAKVKAPPVQAVRGRLPVIVVRPIAHATGWAESEYLLAGFQAEVVSCLVKFRDWVIIEAQEGESSPEADAGLLIDYRLEVRILPAPSEGAVQLVFADATDDHVLWTERYPLRLQDWTAFSSEIARRTAAVLDIYLSADQVSGRSGRRDLSLSAYDDWLRGENLLTLWHPDAELEAEALFKSVIHQMPQFAPAYSSLASIYNVRHLIIAGFVRDPELEAEALKLAFRAVQIDPLETRAHLTLAWSYLMAARYEQAGIHYDLAFGLNPNNPKTLLSCAHGYALAGRKEQATELARVALSLTPFVTPFQWEYLTGIRFIAGDYQGAVAAASMGTGAMHDTRAWKAASLACMGELDDARRAAEDFLVGVRRQWKGDDPDDAAISDWIRKGLPIRDTETRARLDHGLNLAGLSAGGLI